MVCEFRASKDDSVESLDVKSASYCENKSQANRADEESQKYNDESCILRS